MSYKQWFDLRSDIDLRLSCYLSRPETQQTEKGIDRMDERAARMIAECQSTIEKLKEYRQALAARYAQLATMPYKLRLELHRHPSWYGRGITYELLLVKRYEDGTEVNELIETYPGKERRTALQKFDDMQRQRPGIEVIRDTDKKSWEK